MHKVSYSVVYFCANDEGFKHAREIRREKEKEARKYFFSSFFILCY
jgi:hypothetical protein